MDPSVVVNSGYHNYNSCCNSRGVSSRARVLRAVEESEIELPPREIAKRTGINPSTTRSCIRQLLAEGKIVQPYPGFYCSHIIHGMMFAPLRVHNVILTSDCPWLGFSDDVEELVGDVKVRVQYGLQRRQITGRISCDAGMDKNAVLLALQRFYDLVKVRTGRDLEKVTVKTFELNRDFEGVRIDPMAFCYTREGFNGVIERLYQKGDNTLRLENKVSGSMGVDELHVLLNQGVSGYNTQQGLYGILKRVEQLAEAVKFQNRTMFDQQAALREVVGEIASMRQGGLATTQKVEALVDGQLVQTANVLRLTKSLENLAAALGRRESEGAETVGGLPATSTPKCIPASTPEYTSNSVRDLLSQNSYNAAADQKRFISPPAAAGSICPRLRGITCTAVDPPRIPSCVISDYCMNPSVYPGCPYREGGHKL